MMRWMRGNDSSSAGMIGAGLNELHAAFNGTKKTLVVERESRALRRDDEAQEGDAHPGEDEPAADGPPGTADAATGCRRRRRAAWSGAPSVTIRRSDAAEAADRARGVQPPPAPGGDPAPSAGE